MILKTKIVNRVIFDTLFWLLSTLVFAFIFRLSEEINRLDIIYSLFFHLTLLLTVYSNFWAINKWFKKRKNLAYFVFVVVLISIAIPLNQFTFSTLIDFVLSDYYFVSQFNNLEIGLIVSIYLIITTAVKLASSWFELQQANQRIAEEQKEKVDSELQSLKAQINPHFLFNSLNVIYSLTLKKDDMASEVVLKLSDILRYVIYDSQQDKVTLSSEVVLLQNFIDLQRYRIEDTTPINFTTQIQQNVKVAPLLFLTLVENSFKHGIKSDTENVFIDIKLFSDEKKVIFEIENNNTEANIEGKLEKGIGLENIRRRLLLQYPNQHQFRILDNTDTFKVYLEIAHETSVT